MIEFGICRDARRATLNRGREIGQPFPRLLGVPIRETEGAR